MSALLVHVRYPSVDVGLCNRLTAFRLCMARAYMAYAMKSRDRHRKTPARIHPNMLSRRWSSDDRGMKLASCLCFWW